MAFRTKAEPLIAGWLAESPAKIYRRPDLRALFSRARIQELVAKTTSFDQFIQHLIVRRLILAITLTSAEYQKDITRYCARPRPSLWRPRSAAAVI
jgi:hypothetical protein